MKTSIGFAEALELTLAHVAAVGAERRPLLAAAGRVLAEDLHALVDSPSVSTSSKDGFAVVPEDLVAASQDNPARLQWVGSLGAGDMQTVGLAPGQTVRVTTGALIPVGAQAVISEEFCRTEGRTICCFNTAERGRNILQRGTDVHANEKVAGRRERLTPPRLGLIAAAGHGAVRVYKAPRAAVIATGDEVVAPGRPLAPGKLYASNMVAIGAWLALLGIPFETAVVPDRPQAVRTAVLERLPGTDVFITSGGAWGSEKDLILKVVADLGWTGVYHRVRMSPGKPVGFGILDGRPFFALPGGPSSNEMAFLQLCLPALMKMTGAAPAAFPTVPARLSDRVAGARGWTEFIHARLTEGPAGLTAVPIRLKSRLKSMAEKEALIVVTEDRDAIPAGETVDVQVLKFMDDPSIAAS